MNRQLVIRVLDVHGRVVDTASLKMQEGPMLVRFEEVVDARPGEGYEPNRNTLQIPSSYSCRLAETDTDFFRKTVSEEEKDA